MKEGNTQWQGNRFQRAAIHKRIFSYIGNSRGDINALKSRACGKYIIITNGIELRLAVYNEVSDSYVFLDERSLPFHYSISSIQSIKMT